MTQTERNNNNNNAADALMVCKACIEGTVCTAQCDTEPTNPSVVKAHQSSRPPGTFKRLDTHTEEEATPVEEPKDPEEEKKVIEILPRRVSWHESTAATFTNGFFVAVFFVVFIASVAWDAIRSRARVVWAYYFPPADNRTRSADGRFPAWYCQEEAARFWEKKAITRANPGTLISCHDCPFRILEDSLAGAQSAYAWRNPSAIPLNGGGWGPHEEREAWMNTSNAYRAANTILPVCAHPANGKWGEGRYGAHTPDEKTCPRALLAKMNPIRRAYWKWRMKRHIKQHGATPKML